MNKIGKGEIMKLLDLRSVMDKLGGVSRSTVYNLINGGGFPLQVKVGRSSRWREDEIDKWLETAARGPYGTAK